MKKDPGFLNQIPALTKECAPRTFCEEAEVLQKSHVREPQLSHKPSPRFRWVVTLNLAPCRVCDFQDLFSSIHARSERQSDRHIYGSCKMVAQHTAFAGFCATLLLVAVWATPSSEARNEVCPGLRLVDAADVVGLRPHTFQE